MEETANPTSPEAGKSVLGPAMWLEVLRKVIAPKIATIVTQHGNDIENRQQLHRKFCEDYGVKPSYSTFSGWCEDLGISFKKRIEVHIPGWREMPRPSPDFIGPMPAAPTQPMQHQILPVDVRDEEPDAPVQWDTPKQREIPIEAFNDNMPTVLPGGFRAPTFIGDNNFGN